VQVPAWQVSIWVQALPSVHVEPLVFAGFEQAPVEGLQVPALWHWSLATHTTGVPAVQTPVALQSSAPLQALPSLHEVPAATGVWLTPVAGAHESVVHGLPSSTTGGVPKIQTALALHVSAPLQALPSLHDVPAATGVWLTPVEGLQASVVHRLPSSTATAEPAVQVPDWQVSEAVQALPSLHDVPFAFAGFEQRPVEELQVPTL
jgi:hypothetical protein